MARDLTHTIDTPDAQLAAFRSDVLAGLAQHRKRLPSRWLYDDNGSELFEEITGLEEYYPTRTETEILNHRIGDMARFCGPETVVIEYGAGASIKTEILLAGLCRPRAYVPIDIAGDFLEVSAARLRKRFPGLEIRSVVADFMQEFDLPDEIPDGPRTGFFPGSTIGNLDRAEATAFLKRMHAHAGGKEGRAIVGIDLRKSIPRLIAAYDDRRGVTAAFNLNILSRINRELDGTFIIEEFGHEARWNEEDSSIEMHLVSRRDQEVTVAGQPFEFRADETIHTESSRKYSIGSFEAIAAESGWALNEVWQDAERLFAVTGLRAL